MIPKEVKYNLHYDDVPLETKNTQHHENRRLWFDWVSVWLSLI